MNFQLLNDANPLLFAPERVDEYPLDPVELSQFLNNFSVNRERPFTAVDQMDYLFYTDPSTQELDLSKKMACEYAMFQLQSYKNKKEISDPMTFEQLMKLDLNSKDWFDNLLLLLDSINGTKLDLNKLKILEENTQLLDDKLDKSKTMLNEEGTNDTSLINESGEDVVHEITSYLLSNSIKKGIMVKPSENVNDPLKFLKNGIDSIIDTAYENSKNNNSISHDNSFSHDNSVNDDSEDHIGKIEDEDNNTNKKDLQSKLDEMTTAFKDLKLAHNFLTKQFANDRNDYLKDIERLTKTNKELQNKLFANQSEMTKLEDKLHKLELEDLKKPEFDAILPRTPSATEVTSPILSNVERWLPNTPNGIPDNNSTSNLNSPSISIMRNEFKRLLTETQRKYEKEISHERDIRKQLETELKLVHK